MVLLILVETNFWHCLTDLHLFPKLIMTVLTFRDVSKFSGVNTAIVVFVTNESVTYISSFQFQY